MAFEPITTTDVTLFRGDRLRFRVEYGVAPFLAPTEGAILSALQTHPDISIESVELDFFAPIGGNEGTVIGVVKVGSAEISDINAKMRDILGGFIRIWGARITSVEKETFSLEDVIPKTPITTTAALIAIAIIVLAGVFVFQKVT